MAANGKTLEYLIKEGLIRTTPDDAGYITIKTFTNPRGTQATRSQTSEYVIKLSDLLAGLEETADIALVEAALAAHLVDPTDAHDASAVSYDNTVSGLTAIEVQAAIDELAACCAAVGPTPSSFDLQSAAAFVVLAGDDLVDTAPQYFPTGDVGYITSETGDQSFGSGALVTGPVAVTAVADVAALKATLIALPGTDITATAAALETTNVGYGVGTFVPGVYTTAAAIGVTASAVITLSGDGDYVFVSTAGALTFGASVTIILTNGAVASKVYWVASTDLSTTGASSSLKGNFLTRDITVAASNTIEGRFLASRDVTIDGTATGIFLPLA